jgi:hypothetical protein
MLFKPTATAFLSLVAASCVLAADGQLTGRPAGAQDNPIAANPFQLSGTVVDASGAAIAAATVQVQSASGNILTTAQPDTNGAFTISGLPAGDYRLIVSQDGFETKDLPVTIGTTEAPALLRISLDLGSVSTTINVQGRQDDLVGIANSATQGTVGAAELEDRPILRSGEVLETVPGVIITQHAGGGKATNISYADSILTTARISPFSSMTCR